MKQRGINSRDEDAVAHAGCERGTDDSNSTNILTEDNCIDVKRRNEHTNEIENINEQYRIMAQMEASIRVQDNTGFDMVEYKQQLRLLEEEQQQHPQVEVRYHTKPKPKLPNVQKSYSVGGFSGSDGSNLIKGPLPEEPPLPFTRANRRYVQNGRSKNNRRNQLMIDRLVDETEALLFQFVSSSKQTLCISVGIQENHNGRPP